MNKTWSVLIAVLITAIIGVGGSYYYLTAKAAEEKAELQEQIEELNDQINDMQDQIEEMGEEASSKTSSETITEDETADWETYTNTTYNFSINHPNAWKVSDKMQTSGSAGTEDYLKIYKNDSYLRIYYDPAGWGMPYSEIEYSMQIDKGAVVVSDRTENQPYGEGIESSVAKGAINFKKDGSYSIMLNNNPYYINAYSPGLDYENEIIGILSTLTFIN